MNAVGQPGAVNEDIRSFMPFLQEFGIFLEKLPVGPFVPNGAEHLADPLAGDICLWVKHSCIGSFIPGLRVTIGRQAEHVIHNYGIKGVIIAVANGFDGGDET